MIRKSIALLCVAVVLLAALTLEIPSLHSPSLFELSTIQLSVLDRVSTQSDAQPASLLALAYFRAPPMACSFS